MNKQIISYFLLVIILISHAFFRLNWPKAFSFDYDQEMILDKAKSVAQGNLTLIGTRVGNYSLYVGPAYIYLTALLANFCHFSPYFMFYYAYFWSLLTLVALLYFTERIYSPQISYLVCLIYSLSPLYISLDRIGWNPNVIPFISITVIGLICLSTKRHQPLSYAQLVFIGLLLGLGVSSHFTAIIIGVWYVSYTSIHRSLKALFIPLVLMLLFLLPILVFDFRHQFLNFHGLWQLVFSSRDHEVSVSIFNQSKRIIFIIGEIITKAYGFRFSGHYLTQVIFGWVVLFIGLFSLPKDLRNIFFGFLVSGIIIFSFYSGQVPEYYFLFLSPVILWVPIALLTLLPPFLTITTEAIMLSVLISRVISYHPDNNQSLQCKLDALERIHTLTETQPVNLDYRMELRWVYGYGYLEKYLGIDKQPYARQTYLLDYPVNEKTKSTYDETFCNIGIKKIR